MPFTLRPFLRSLVYCFVKYDAGPFAGVSPAWNRSCAECRLSGKWSDGRGEQGACAPCTSQSPKPQYTDSCIGPRTHQTYKPGKASSLLAAPTLPVMFTVHALVGWDTDVVADQ
jgi:hypothetical protein